jgi:RNA polymerase sigma-70 factor (family 1)
LAHNISYSEEELLALLQRGDEAAFTEIYRRYWDRLYVVASHTLGSHQEAEEAVHDVFLKIWKRRETIVIRQTLRQYLAVAIKHEVIDRLRKQLRRRQLFEKFEQGSAITQGSLITKGSAITNDPTGEYIREKELAAELETTIRALPEKCQIVFRLSRGEGYSQREIARALGLSENTIESHMRRALHTLRNKFQRLLFLF